MDRLEVDTAFARVVAALDRSYPGAFRIEPVRLVVNGEDEVVAQIGSQEENLDRAQRFMVEKMMKMERGSPAYKQLLRLNEQVGGMRAWLMTPAHVRRTYRSLANFQRVRGVIEHDDRPGLFSRLAGMLRKPGMSLRRLSIS